MANPTYQHIQTKEQDKTPEEELNKVVISGLPDSNDHKDSQWTSEKTGWTQWEI